MLRLTLSSGALRVGDRMISARKLAEREHVSLPTALEALRCLEAEGLIVARPRSGYYIRQISLPPRAEPARSTPGPVPVTMSAVARSLFSSAEARLIPLGAALPDPAWLPGDALQRALHSAGRRLDAHGQSYSLPPGRRDLRSKIAARLRSGEPVSARTISLLPQARRRRCAWPCGPCASRVMWWRLSSPPTLARSCCWRI
jgi:DNA-binding transcriptional MocR family regulator